ncbi:peptide chain release factor 2 [Gimesia sp.]|uniref:peptide chain release factor 2 n=1 Tax=Gimesia sp. TaxID=2024833 RepID=UPI003A8F22F2
MDHELKEKCTGIMDRIVKLRDSLDYADKKKRAAEINELMGAAGFWDNQEKAQGLVNEMQQIQLIVKPLNQLVEGAEDLEVLMEFIEEEGSEDSIPELAATAERLESTLEHLELQAMMSAPEDGSAAYLSIQAGEGGTDSSDWAEMLLRMYLRWCERRGFNVELLDRSDAEEAGIRSATIRIEGDYAYGYLKGETGNHRLIRISPFDSAGRRHTSFAAIDVSPDMGEIAEIEINWDQDVREDTYRASGAGGQHINKTDSAIRLTHLESGVVVQCQNNRSQHKNRAEARKMLKAKLFQIEQEKRDAELAAKRGGKSKIGFGGQTVRNYVLHPDQYVKDARTGYKAGNPGPILDGDLDGFLEAFLRWGMTEN